MTRHCHQRPPRGPLRADDGGGIGFRGQCCWPATPGQSRCLLLFLAGALVASPADFLAEDPAPSWLVRVGTRLGRHFRACGLGLCPGSASLFLAEPGLRLFAILLGPAAKETHGAILGGSLRTPRQLRVDTHIIRKPV